MEAAVEAGRGGQERVHTAITTKSKVLYGIFLLFTMDNDLCVNFANVYNSLYSNV